MVITQYFTFTYSYTLLQTNFDLNSHLHSVYHMLSILCVKLRSTQAEVKPLKISFLIKFPSQLLFLRLDVLGFEMVSKHPVVMGIPLCML